MSLIAGFHAGGIRSGILSAMVCLALRIRLTSSPVSAAAVARLWKTDFDTLDYSTALGA